MSAGSVTAEQAEQLWFVGQLAMNLEHELGLTGLSRVEIAGTSHGATVLSSPEGTAVVLATQPGVDITPLLRTLGGEA